MPERQVNDKTCRFGKIASTALRMSRFSRAYEGAIKAAGLTKAQAAAAAGMDASVVTRILSDERPAQPEHVAALIVALPDQSDREHCVLEFLTDQCPPALRERLRLSFGVAREAPGKREDSLSRHLGELERAATDNPDLRKLLGNLTSLLADTDDKRGA